MKKTQLLSLLSPIIVIQFWDHKMKQTYLIFLPAALCVWALTNAFPVDASFIFTVSTDKRQRQNRHSQTTYGQYSGLVQRGSSCGVMFGATPPTGFDFSSAQAWDQYYRTSVPRADDDTSTSSSSSSLPLSEWHASIPMETLVQLVPFDTKSIVMVGCGTSLLPQWIRTHRPKARLILQDSSETCLEILKDRHGEEDHLIEYACGDATKLSDCIGVDKSVDVIYDKGLMDALFCSEGWNTPIQSLVEESAKILSDNGIYILVSYRLPKSTKEFLQEVGTKNGLTWTFDIPNSNNRVGISMGKKTCS